MDKDQDKFFLYYTGSDIHGWDQNPAGVWTPFEQMKEVKSFLKGFKELMDRDHRFFVKELITREKLPLFIEAVSLANAKREIQAVKRFIDAPENSQLTPGVYLELNTTKTPISVLNVILKTNFEKPAAKGPLMDYFLLAKTKDLQQSMEQDKRKIFRHLIETPPWKKPGKKR